MNLNNFVVLTSKPKSMKLNVRNLRELRMETVQLDQQTKEMEHKLEELRERMSQEKEEREKMGASRWRSAQPGVVAPVFQNAKTNKEKATHRLSPGKMKIRVLKDEPLPVVQKQVTSEPAVNPRTNRKLRLKGKACGQCEVQLAGLMCSECGEDYCVSCFVRFHQKGALQRHRMIPIQAQLQTPVTTRDVMEHAQLQVQHEQSQLTQATIPRSDDQKEQTPASKNIQTHQTQVLFVNDGGNVEDEEGGEEDDSSLLRGHFDEEESARSFQEALKEWREKEFRPRPTPERPVSATETQTEKRHQQVVHLEFKDDTLSYMEKLLVKKSRRGQIEQFQPRYAASCRPASPTSPPAETDELCHKLTAEQMELRKYFASLFTTAPAEDAGKMNGPAESCLSIMELDEMVTDAATYRSFGVVEENESKMSFSSAGNEHLALQNEEAEFGCSMITSTPFLSKMSRSSEVSSSPELWPASQETDQLSLPLPKTGSSPIPLKHSTATTESSESFLNVPSEGQKVEHSSQVMLSTTIGDSPKPKSWTRSFTAQQKKPSELGPPSSPLSPKTELNPILPNCDFAVSPPSAGSSLFHSLAFLNPKPSPEPSGFLSPSFRMASSPMNPMNSRLDLLTPPTEQKLSPPPPECVIASSCSAASSLKLSPVGTSPVLSVHDFSRSSHTDGFSSPPPSKWLKGRRRSPKTTTLSLELSMSDSEEEMTAEDVCPVPSEEDSSDEELRCINDSEVMKNAVSSPCPTMTPVADSPFNFLRPSERENTEPGLLTESSQALHYVAQRQLVGPVHDRGLEGFLTLGLDTSDLKPSPTPARSPRERESNTECSLVGVPEFWRPSSSLQHHAEEELVAALVNHQPIRSPLRPVTPRYGPMTSQSHQNLLSRCSSSTQTPSTPRPSPLFRPLSRAAQEIMEVQTVDRPELQNSDEEEEDCLALAGLEEEFRNMSCTPCGRDENGHTQMA